VIVGVMVMVNAVIIFRCRIEDIPLLKFIKDGYNTPMNALFSTTKLALTILGDQPMLPRIVWQTDDFESLVIDGRKVNLDDLRRLVRACIKKCQEKLDFVLCGMPISSRTLSKSVTDAHTNVSDGYSFLQDPSNRLTKFKTSLPNHLLKSRTLSRRYEEIRNEGRE
jgi:hypothetical protein